MNWLEGGSMLWLRMGLAPLSVVLALTCLVVAQSRETPTGAPVEPAEQEKGPQDQPPSKDKGKGPTPSEDLRDPTVLGAKLKEAMDKGKVGSLQLSKLPQVVLKGRVLAKDRPPLAMLEVDGKLFMVAKGSALMSAGTMIVRVIDVTGAEIRLEVGPLNEVITLR